MTELKNIVATGSWAASREAVESALNTLLGKMPRERVDLQFNILDEQDCPGYSRKRVNYFVDEWTRVSAWLFVPDGADGAPGILCCHQESKFAKDEAAGLKDRGNPRLAFAKELAELGYVTLAPDCITAGERVSSRLEPYDTEAFYKENPKISVLGKMLVDHGHAIDAFAEVREVDTERIGVAGHGLGATNALLLAATDNRIGACVASCGFTRLEDDTDPARWARDEGLVLLPGMRAHVEAGEFPFDWEHILALAAPAATLIISNTKDSPYAKPKSCKKAVEQAKAVYKQLGAAKALEYYEHADGHTVTSETMNLITDWFERWL